MAIADITVIPLGKETTGVSDVVAEIHSLLEHTAEPVSVQLTPMSTLIEGDAAVLYSLLAEIHEVPFKLGFKRTAVNIRIDDRRDKDSNMAGKLASVNTRLKDKDGDE
ncbi:MTH1187 family thiamine-binding protein [Salisediminibacterium halotolerans]|uniref:Uncharacterized protein, MTH1187 family n=1 Tax=Salisediminibacterium halotolerans TaxID=517425 RepID=A0A1H9SAX0_9BACI|nr:MTH1187 family thiamine-binding protein [Salisediminibacterium haloalkalitolerans]SER82068.1 uncharacterized protein, MTH1187 family [Salisediminibacterium haloalkalitolerans]